MKLANFLRVSVMLCSLAWMTNSSVKETAHFPKPELPKIAFADKSSTPVDQNLYQQYAKKSRATTQQQVSELSPALKWLTPYLTPARDRARGQKWLSPFVPSITAIKTASQLGTDMGTSGPTPGDTLRYVVIIQNAAGAMDATAVQFTDQIDANTTLVPGSLKSAPIAVDDSYSTVGNTSISVPAGSGLLANDVNLNGTTMSATAINQAGTMGTVSANPDGSFTFNPNPGFEGTTTFTYTVSNGSYASVGTVTITVTGMIWYINASAPAGGDGRINTPWNSMNAFNASSLDDPGDNIFVYTGTYTNTLSTILLGQQKLIGQGAVGASLAALAGVTFSVHPPISPATIPAVNGTSPTINQSANNINMQSQNEVRGVNINNTGGTALLGSGFTSALVREVNITNTGGVGVSFTNGALNMIIQKVNVSSSSTGIFLSQTTGSFQITGTGTTDGSGGTFSNISGRGIELRNVTNITLKNLSMPSANNATDGGFAGVCDETFVTGCYAAIYMDMANTVTLDNIDIGSTKEHGIMGNNVSNLSITNCTATDNGDAEEENALKFRNLSGTCSITGSTFQNSAYRIAHIINTTGNLNLTVTNCTFNNTAASAVGQDCFEMRTQGAATATVLLTGSSFQRARSKAVQIQAEGSSTLNLNMNSCRVERFGGAMAGIDVGSNGSGSTINYNIINNVVIESSGEVAVLASTLNSTLNGRLNANQSIDNNYPLAGGSTFAITRVLNDGSSIAKLEMKQNSSITGTNLDLPVDFQSINGNSAAHRFDLIVDANEISNNASGGVGIEGMYLRVGTSSTGGKINTLCGDITRNKVTVPASAGGRAFRANRVDNSSFLTLSGMSPVATMWTGNSNTNINGTINASAGVVFTGVAPPGCIAPTHASFAPFNEEVASIVREGKVNDQALNSVNDNNDISGLQKNAPVKSKAPNEKEAEPTVLGMMMSGETVTVGAPSGFLLPAGKQITIRFDVVINTSLPAGVCQISNQGSVSGSNFSTILTDNVAGGSVDPTVVQLSKHSLGDRVFKDNNKNGVFDGGDAGIVGVLVNLYRDNGTTPGILDVSDDFVTSTNTTAGGLYLFTNLCSDEYIVQIPSSEFGVGKPLNGLISSPTSAAPDPDNNIDNDDNGQDAFGSSIASQAITINYSNGFVENNTTLDFGFKTPTNVSINDLTLNEGSGGGTTNFTFTITRDDISEAFNLDVNTSVISTNNGDYTAISGGTVSFTAGGSNTASVTVVVTADDIVELTETFNVLLSNAPAGVVITDGSGLGTITNDDQATLSINSVSNTEGDMGTQTYTFTVTSDKAVDVPFTVNAATANGTATTGDNDYVAVSSTTLNFAGTAGETQTFNVTVNGDMKVEPTETFTVPLSTVSASGRNVVISGVNGTGTGTITNDDAATISINDVSLAEGNAGFTNFVFNVTLDRVVSTPITVDFTTANGTAGAGDYNTSSGTITFPANGTAQTQTITVQVIGDLVGEANETFFVNLSNIVGSTSVIFELFSGRGTILDDDLSFSINDVAVAEGNAGTTNLTFTVTRTNTTTAETINYQTSDNTATTSDNDYVAKNGTLNFAIGDATEDIIIVINGDNIVEATETFFVNLSAASNGSIADAQGVGTITNDDLATITLSGGIAKNEGNAGTTSYTFTATLNKAVTGGLSVPFNTNDGTATTADNDYQDNDGTLIFAGTANETQDITVLVNGDTKVEANETFTVSLGAITGALANAVSAVGSPQTGTITNDDAATVTLAPISATANEGNAGTTNFTFSVTLDNPVAGGFNLAYTTSDGTATTADNDYVDNDNSLSFAGTVGESKTITVQVNGDTKVEANETFSVALGALSGTTLGSSISLAGSPQTGTINNDDAATITLAPISATANEGNAGTTNRTFSVTLDNPVAGGFNLAYTTSDGTATTADNDYVDNDNTLSFAGTVGESKTITVQVNGDTKVEANETFSVALGALSGTTLSSNITLAGSPQTGIITNDDAATITLAPISATANEGNAGMTNRTFSVTLDNPVAGGFNLAYTTSDGTATTADNDYVDNDNTLSFAGTVGESKTITVQVNGDTKVEANETFSVALGALSGTTLGSSISLAGSPQTGTITNDDAATVTLAPISATANEGNAGTTNRTFSVTLDNPVAGGFNLAYTTSDGTATTADNDYVDNDNTLSFAGTVGESKTITVQVNGDTKVEANETFSVALGALSGTTLGSSITLAGSPQTGTITNDDAAQVNIQANVTQSENMTPQTFTITLSNPVDVNVTVDLSTTSGTATAGSDYTTITNQSVSFLAGSTNAKTVDVTIVNENMVEADETYMVSIANLQATGRNVTLGANTSRIGTIVNDDNATVTLSGGISQNEGNTANTTFNFTAKLNNPVQGGLTASYSTNDQTATIANNDYIDNDGTLTFVGTANESQIFSVTVVADNTVEGNETFQTFINSLSLPVGISVSAVSIAGSPQTATILNDEVDFGDAPDTYATLLVSNGARHKTVFGFYLGGGIDGEVDGLPSANADGEGADDDGVTLPNPLVTSTTANVVINASLAGYIDGWVDFNNDGDFSDPGEQVFTSAAVVAGNNSLSFLVPNGATPALTFARFRLSSTGSLSFNGLASDGEVEDYQIQIVNTQFSINDPIITEGNAGTSNLSFVITRSNNASTSSVQYAITGGTAQSGSDYQVFATGTASFTAGSALTQNINVEVKGDLTVELDETVIMTLSNPINGTIIDATGMGTINNDDAATLSVSNPSVAEGGPINTVSLTFTLTLNNPSDANVVVNYTTLDGTATTANNDYQGTNGTHTFAPGQTSKQVVVTVNGDCDIEATESMKLRLSNLQNNARVISLNGGAATTDGTGTITNDDFSPSFTVTGGGARCTSDSQGLPVGLNGSQLGVNYQLQLNGNNVGSVVAGTGNPITFGEQLAEGTYTVVATVTSTGCSQNMLGAVTVSSTSCDPSISDPCICQNNAQIGQNGKSSNTGTFSDKVTIKGPINQDWTVASVTGLYEDAAGTNPVDIGDALTPVSPGIYELLGYHVDSIGYSISVTNSRGTTLSISNKCFYPDPLFSGLPNLVLPTALPFTVKGGALNSAAGTGTFKLNGVTQTGASSQPTLLTINPASLPKGTNTLEYTFDAGAPGSNVNDPGCVKTVTQKFEVAACGCQAINVTLDKQCKFLLTPYIVSEGNCNSGTVRVMDSDPSNGGVIDCAGVFTYGLFDDFNNLICWGKVTAEDKTAPSFSTNYLPTPLLCSDISTVLNNAKTIGNVGTVVSPGFSAATDDVKNVGQVIFTDNCVNCGCTVTRKWSDKVVYYGCDSINSQRIPNLYATIFRTWSGVDCNGNTSVTVQEINFVRPSLADFKFLDDAETDLSNGKPYNAITVYNNCKADESLIKTNDYIPYITSYFGNKVYLDKQECNFSVGTLVDERFPICNGTGVKIDRKIPIFDWCAGKIVDTLHVLIKIGDFEAPTLALPAKLPITLSTGPMDCTASFLGNSVAGLKNAFGITLSDNCDKVSVATRVRTLGKIVYGIVVDQTTWYNVDYKVINGYTSGLPVGRHKLIISAYDGCYNTLTDSVDFYVLDRIAPVMKCDDKITVTLSNGNGYTSGYARVDAKDIDEGSSDNCNLDWIRVRRSVAASCYQSFIDKGYDTNGNGKLDTLDGFDNNGNGKLEPELLETFRNKNGTLMTPLQSFVEFFCCDAGNAVRTELWGRDGELIVGYYDDAKIVSGGNLNFCWQDIVIEDKVAPVCMAPLDVTIDCLDKNLQYLLGDAKNKSIIAAAAKIFGDVTIMSGSDCANLDTTYTVTTDLKCGYGTIKRSWTLTKKTSKGPLSTTCSQTIYVKPVHEYNICFPKDAVVNCRTKVTADTVKVDELACDILAVNVSDKRYAASDDECYKIFRTYTVINWCTYDDRCGDPMSPDNVYTVDRKWGEFGKYPTYVLVRQWEEIAEKKRGYGHNQFFLSRDTIVDNWNTASYGKLSNDKLGDQDDERIYPESDCKGWGNEHRYRDRDDREHRGFIHSWMYTQIIKVYDTERPVVKQPKLPTCPSSSAVPGAASINFPIDPASCVGAVSIAFKGSDNCSTALELEPGLIKVEDSKGGVKLPSDYDTKWSTARLASDSFKVSIKGFASGSYNLIVVIRDECGNLSVATRIPFVVGDCKAPVPICINGLSTDLMPVKGGGAMTVWAKDFIASPAYDCNGQGNSTDPKDGPNTKDGLKLITKYSINKVGQPADVNATSLTFTCDDAGRQTIVEIHAWDEKGNHDFCVTYILIGDFNKVCPDNLKGDGEIAGLIQTEAKQSVQGVSVELSGKAVKGMSTASDGKYSFTGLEKGYDYTVTPSLDANPLNGVSTFDLVLMQKHILGIQPLDSPYKMIAADINNSKSITTLDLILLRKLILNLDTKFTANTSWRFVDAAYRFPNPSNPWSEAFPEISSINNLSGKANADFVAVKIGDVNGNASPTSAAAAQPRKSGKLELSTEEQRIEGGQQYRVDIRAKDLKTIEGYQFTLELDRNKVDLVDLEYGVAKAEHFGIFQREGIITTSWNRKGGAENEDAILFTLHLQGKGAAKLSEALTISSRYTANEAYQVGGDYLSVAMSYTKPVVISDRPELLQNTPNPFSDQTQIGFYLPQATEGRLTIRDAKGSIVYRLKADYNQGWNQVTIKNSDLKAVGVLYYTLETPDFIGTKKMVVVNK